jgi:hypothetical protein
MSDTEGDAVRAMKEEHPEWFEQIREGLVVRPGDHLILSFPADSSPKDLAEFRDRIREQLQPIGPDIQVTLVAGVDQITVIRGGAS